MNKLALVAAAALSVATLGTAAAYAQAGSTDKFGDVDGNKDGMVSMTEAMGAYPTLTQALFDQADANHDGNLDQTEFGTLEGLMGSNNGGNSDTTTPSDAGDGSSSAAM